MPWLQLRAVTDASHVEPLSELLSELGAVAVTYEDGADQPLFEPDPGETRLWRETRVTGLFEADADMERITAALAATDLPLPHISVDPLEDREWSRAWMEAFEPIRCGERLWIVPSWHQPADPAAVNVVLDPGLAFGTGTHPTTALCLEWLDAHPPEGFEVIDYGCGSGILAVAAALLGARKVWAVDHDPQALVATRDNAAKNGVAERIHTCLPDELPRITADLLIANILANPLLELAPRFARLTRPGAPLVLSGILAPQAEQIRERYETWFRMNPPRQREEWIELDGIRRPGEA